MKGLKNRLLITLLLSSNLFGISLIEKAKKSGLLPIPNTKDELLREIDPKGLLHQKGLSLEKCYILSQDYLKVL